MRAYMAHHQGMTIVAIADALHDGRMRERFHADPIVRRPNCCCRNGCRAMSPSTRPAPTRLKAGDQSPRPDPADAAPRSIRPIRAVPAHPSAVQRPLRGHGDRCRRRATAAGATSPSRAGARMSTCDRWGTYIFLRDVGSGEVWSAGYQPTRREPDSYEVIFSEDRAEIRAPRRLDHDHHVEVVVSPEDDAEVRRVIDHQSRHPHARDRAHLLCRDRAGAAGRRRAPIRPSPSCSCRRSSSPRRGALLATRRRRSPGDPQVWAAHLCRRRGRDASATCNSRPTGRASWAAAAASARRVSHDRRPAAFQYRRHGARSDLQPAPPRARSRRRTTVRVAFWTMVAPRARRGARSGGQASRANRLRARRARWPGPRRRCSFTISASQRRRSASLPAPRQSRALLRSDAAAPVRIAAAQRLRTASLLWPHGISGDLPIVLVRIDEVDDLEIVRQLLRAHEYWRMKQLAVDLVILNERPPSYAQDLQTGIEALVRMSQSRHGPTGRRAGKVFVLRADLVSAEARDAAPDGRRGRAAQPSRQRSPSRSKRLREVRAQHGAAARRAGARTAWRSATSRRARSWRISTGSAASAAEGGEYVTILGRGQTHARALDQCDRQSILRLPGLRRGRRLQLVGQQPGEPAHALVERSGQRSAGRGHLCARRGQRRGLDARRRSPIREETSPYIARHGQGYSRFEHAVARHLARAPAIRAAEGSDQDFAADDPQRVRSAIGGSR